MTRIDGSTLTVAVTGGIGAGKSTVAAQLASLGAILIDSDQLAREVVAPGSAGLAAIVAEFGGGVLSDDGALDRAALARVVFTDPAARRTLESITHPLVRDRFRSLRDAAPSGSVVVNDIPLLVDLVAAASFHLVVGVWADEAVRIRRLVGRGLPEPDARARIGAQIPDAARRALCDGWLPNNAGPEAVSVLAERLWTERLVPFRDNIGAGRGATRPGPALVEPVATWPADAARLRARISRAVGGARVDHIGSTSIPGLPAKDVIDLQLTVDSLDQADSWRQALTAVGFPRYPGIVDDTPHPAGADPSLWGKRLHTNADPDRHVNVHLRVRDSPGWRWALLFRDWLTQDRQVREDYLRMKRAVAAEHARDATMHGYATAKEPFFAGAYPRGLSWAQATGWHPGDLR
jgi:dephospho-CoA kinase